MRHSQQDILSTIDVPIHAEQHCLVRYELRSKSWGLMSRYRRLVSLPCHNFCVYGYCHLTFT